jgi:formate hydrogenlyase subunit 3/multisubunit Na+/H+ antiporter MnhD subunit
MISIENTQGLFLLLISILAGYFIPTMSCQVQRRLKQSIWIRYIVLFCLAYFSINFTGSKNQSPESQLKSTAYLVALFIVFNRMDFNFTALVFIALTALLFMEHWIQYYSHKDYQQQELDNVRRLQEGTYYAIYMLLIVGVSMYASRKYQAKRDFSWTTFFLGKSYCS